ncbi:phage tail protein [Microbulbifer thermotolerans]|uniref:phage tail protein n=1 Tax=Microbulbifer thermotolerans TaxID=252514 RepID=UPI00224AE1BA|nr:phage tail protein [Microbulbifer thermotolerans]MCX2834463.1 phage tail protein [Microbulbifer thermotolerans]
MALEKLKGITAHLLDANLVAAEQLDSWMENGQLETASKSLGNGLRVCRQSYDAVIQIERYAGDPALLFALVTTWLMEHDSERVDLELPEPDVDIDVIDERVADVEITIRFTEDVDLVEDGSGPISYRGKRWAVAPVPVDEPDQVAVGDNKALPTDAPYVRD